ncbi:hypothetical protein CORC01_07945 [Colletotrichum orchidophilum]|uniref:2EXR domain-containing protein n=1 Tax=Colletotrichum orchidophilum TaxID=1209926 RepID=A0A1G4B5T0_9PEZI|nr:uncharacterized protein CORC01_07945 [Colletotrichum orchidophilum]OHE96799.1 hypothetical protein CORC01_07945 [Colletotrichum orchidophilum]
MSDSVKFEPFLRLPVELRYLIWNASLEPQGRLVVVSPKCDWLARRCRLPVMSAVHYESRKEFLRLYTRLIDEVPDQRLHTAFRDRKVEDHVYLNTRIDTLVLGTVTNTSVVDQHLHLFRPVLSLTTPDYTVGVMIDMPTLSRRDRNRLRRVRLHDTNYLQQVFNLRIKRKAGIHHRVPGRGIAPLPTLHFPNLEVIYLVSLRTLITMLDGGLHLQTPGFGMHFRYVVPTNELYRKVHDIRHHEYFAGVRPNYKTPPNCDEAYGSKSNGMRIDIIHSGNLDWVTGD